jgi:hypothetical protein
MQAIKKQKQKIIKKHCMQWYHLIILSTPSPELKSSHLILFSLAACTRLVSTIRNVERSNCFPRLGISGSVIRAVAFTSNDRERFPVVCHGSIKTYGPHLKPLDLEGRTHVFFFQYFAGKINDVIRCHQHIRRGKSDRFAYEHTL